MADLLRPELAATRGPTAGRSGFAPVVPETELPAGKWGRGLTDLTLVMKTYNCFWFGKIQTFTYLFNCFVTDLLRPIFP